MTKLTSRLNKRESHKDRLLALLSDGKVHPMGELLKVGGFRYGGRLFDLRKEGYIIDTLRLADDVYGYRLVVENKQGILI